jgi:hypothetical protein
LFVLQTLDLGPWLRQRMLNLLSHARHLK